MNASGPARYASAPFESAAGIDVIACETRPAARKPLHVAVALGGTDCGKSGIGTYVRELLPPLIGSLRSAGGNVTVFGTATELGAYASACAGATTKALRGVPSSPGLNALWHLARAGAFARRCGADVLLLPAANRRITHSDAQIPTVAVVHDLAQLRVAGKYDALRMAYFRRLLLPAFQRPTRVIAVSGATRDDLVGELGLASERVSVVYNGVNTALFRAIDPNSELVRSARQSTGLARRPYLLYPARLEHPGKNHVRLIRAFAKSGLAATHDLALTGGDWGARGLILDTIRAEHLDSVAHLVGFVEPATLPPLVAGAEAVLMLGLHEGFGLPALEALSAGRPVCVSNTGALPEVVGGFGVQCDPLDEDAIAAALRRVVLDADLRRACEEAGPAWADRFTWARTAEGVLDACAEAIA